jgi:site-specific recombinase XerD
MTSSLTLPPSLIDQTLEADPHVRSPHTRRQYAANLRKFEAWRDGRLMTKLLVEAYAAELQEKGLSHTTINQKIASIRWWCRKIIDIAHENLPPTEAEALEKQAGRVLAVRDLKGTSLQRGRHLKLSEITKLLLACADDQSLAGIRDTALFYCSWATGKRRAELGSLTTENITHLETVDKETSEITHYIEFVVTGKGEKPLKSYLFGEAHQAMLTWLNERGEAPGFVFCPINKSGAPLPTSGLSGESLRRILDKRIKQAGIQSLTWHDFGRTLAGNLLDANDIVTVQRILGHASPTTTARYDRRGEINRMEASKNLVQPKIGAGNE